jgi:branched-chain amino acid transport system substrate-binding protein
MNWSSKRPIPSRIPVSLWAVFLVTIVATACGTRVGETDPQAIARSDQGGTAPGTGLRPIVDGGGSENPESNPVAASPIPTGGSSASASVGQRAGAPAVAPGAVSGGTAASQSRGTEVGEAQGRAPSSGSPRPAQPGVSPPATVPPSGQRSPVVIASVGTYSGVIGNSCSPGLAGAQLWVAKINRQGGVNGHKVELAVYDDGLDPARHRGQVQDAIERRGAIAFVFNCEPFTGKASLDYVTQKRIPMIGGSGGTAWAYESPMYFPHMSDADYFWSVYPAATARRFLPEGKKKVGTVVCAEGDACEQSARIWAKRAPESGLQHVYRVRASGAQPDYTAECLGARNAGVEILYVLHVPSAASNLVKSCARQGFTPAYVFPGQSLAPLMETELFDGVVSFATVFPWFLSGTPATDEFQAAFKAFYGDSKQVPYIAPFGWVAAKVFEKAAANLPEPPTAAALLSGLWTFRNETLGGLTSPLTFVENQTAKPSVCWFDVVNQKGKWTSPDGGQPHCA